MADIKISALPVASTISDADIVVINQDNITKTATRALVRGTVNAGTVTSITAGTGLTGGTITGSGTIALSSPVSVVNGGTGVAISSGANSVVLRDASQNITVNSAIEGFTTIAASATQITLTIASTPSYLVTGSGGQVIKLPNATTLQNGVVYLFNNNQSSGAISVNDNSNTLIASIPSGGFTAVSLLSNAIAAGSWERHEQAPSNVTWSTNTLDYPGSITSATWNGNAVQVNRGGTGASTLTGLVKGNGTSAFTAATAGTDYVIPSGNITGTAAGLSTTLVVGAGGTGVQTITGLVKGNGSTAFTAATAGTDYVVPSGSITGNANTATSAGKATNIAGGVTGSLPFQGSVDSTTLLAPNTTATKKFLSETGTGSLGQPPIWDTIAVANVSGAATSGANTNITSVALTATSTSTATPASANDIVNKAYADSIGSGVNFHDAAEYATVAGLPAYAYANGTSGVGASITATTNGALSIDGSAVAVTTPRQRVLIKNETAGNAPYNGIYTVERAGGASETFQLVRATDYDTSGSGTNEINQGDFVLILAGSTLANTAWVQQTRLPITVGTTNITFTQFAAAAPGVTSFSAGTTGLSVNQSTGAVTLAGTLDVDNGGTGATTAQNALNTLAGGNGFVFGFNGFPLVSDGSNVTFSSINLAAAGTVSGQLPIANGGTGAASAAAALAALGGVASADVRVFTASGTWTKPTGAKSVLVQLISAGGGGGGGRKDTTVLTARGGGGGGAGGNIYEIIVPASVLAATESVSIGAGGIGGTGVTGSIANGTAGAQGGATSFNSFQIPGAFGGGGGGTTGGTGGNSLFNGNSGGVGGLTSQGFNGLPAATNIVFSAGGAGGAGGGPINITDVAGGGGVGGLARIFSLAGGTAGAATGAAGGAGVAVTSASSGIFTVGSGGGGGGAGLTVSGGAGGVGGFPGGGGGGGGATRDGTTSGAGANGAAGMAIITTYF